MALTRKFLAALGIEADKVEEIISAHMETVNGLKDEKEALQVKADQVDSLTEELNELKENSKNDGKYKVKYDALKTEFDEYKENQQKEADAKVKTDVYTKLLKDAGVSEKRIDAILKVSKDQIDALELDDEDNAKNADDLNKKIVEDWSDFIVTEGQQGAKTPTPPTGSSGAPTTKEEIMKITDAGERQKAIAENHELFGF